jgi:hypothetical protein
MAKPDTLTPDWQQWRTARRREMIRAGMPLASATWAADAEARGRARIAAHIGDAAARAARLVAVPDGRGGQKFALMLDPRRVPGHLRDAAETALAPDIAPLV